MGRIEWENAKTRLDALLVIDEYRTDPNETWLRLIVKTEDSYGVRYLIDNGSGDSLDVIFTDKIILIKGFDHESSLSQFAADEWNQDIIDGFYKGLDEKYLSLYSEDQKDETTFFIWYDGQEHQNTYQEQDGGEWLLSYFFDSFEKFHEFVTDYYSITVDEDLLRKLYNQGQLSEVELEQLIRTSQLEMCIKSDEKN